MASKGTRTRDDTGDAKSVTYKYPHAAIEALRRYSIGGKPRRFTSASDIIQQAQEYFQYCQDKEEAITITGIASWFGTTRNILIAYLDGQHSLDRIDQDMMDGIIDPDGDYTNIRYALKRVRHVAEAFAEQHLFSARNPAGGIFALKNYGWKDIQTIENTGTIEHRADPETLQILGDFLRSLSAPKPPDLIDITPSTEEVKTPPEAVSSLHLEPGNAKKRANNDDNVL